MKTLSEYPGGVRYRKEPNVGKCACGCRRRFVQNVSGRGRMYFGNHARREAQRQYIKRKKGRGYYGSNAVTQAILDGLGA